MIDIGAQTAYCASQHQGRCARRTGFTSALHLVVSGVAAEAGVAAGADAAWGEARGASLAAGVPALAAGVSALPAGGPVLAAAVPVPVLRAAMAALERRLCSADSSHWATEVHVVSIKLLCSGHTWQELSPDSTQCQGYVQ